jgi:hypothetical protein
MALGMLLVFGLILVPHTKAQSSVRELASLQIELWPDYDQPQVLVLLTGTLADDVPTPATIALPLPEDASINAVAHASEESGSLENIADVDTDTPGQLTFTTPSPTFRIEYYVPYTSDGDRHNVVFDWLSDMTVDQVFAVVQQPADASNFELSPEAEQSSPGQDGLIYHSLASLALPAGLSYSLEASYDLPSGQLSADILAARQVQVEGPLPVVSDPAQPSSPEFNWPLVAIVAGGLIIVAAVTWFLYTSYTNNRKRSPRPRPRRTNVARSSGTAKASSPSSAAQFCHNCGNQVDTEDQFCRKCGTQLKGR